jgi:excisionase family DNA binding protein
MQRVLRGSYDVVLAGRRSLSTGAAAREAGCERSTIRRAIERGELSAVRLGPTGNYRIAREELARWLRPTTEETP